jgi:hypothetical protein
MRACLVCLAAWLYFPVATFGQFAYDRHVISTIASRMLVVLQRTGFRGREHGAKPGADCGDDRKSPHRTDLEGVPVQPGDAAGVGRHRPPQGLSRDARLAMTIYFVAASDERLAFRILATTPTLRSATSEILYSMEVPKTEATSALVSL